MGIAPAILAVVLAGPLAGADARANITRVTWTNNQGVSEGPIVVGQLFTVMAVTDENGWNPYGWSWTYQWKSSDGLCVPKPDPIGSTGSDFQWASFYPGSATATVTGTPPPSLQPPPKPQTQPRQLTILPVDTFDIGGDITPDPTTGAAHKNSLKFYGGTVDSSGTLTIKYYPKNTASGIPLGTNLKGMWAQERITLLWNGAGPVNPPNGVRGDWTPAAAGDPKFYMQGNIIFDVKGGFAPTLQGWNAIPIGKVGGPVTYQGGVWNIIIQELRLVYSDPCNVVQYMPLGSVKLLRRKVDANSYVIEVTQ